MNMLTGCAECDEHYVAELPPTRFTPDYGYALEVHRAMHEVGRAMTEAATRAATYVIERFEAVR